MSDPAILLKDAIIDDAHMDRLFGAIFDTTGQICMNAKRIYVHRSRMDELVKALASRLENTKLGYGLDKDTTMGPLHSPLQKRFVDELIAEASHALAALHESGKLDLVSRDDAPDAPLKVRWTWRYVAGDVDPQNEFELAKDLLNLFALNRAGTFDIREWLRKPLFVPESKRVNVLLKDMRVGRNHMAIAVDEYGSVAGLVRSYQSPTKKRLK